MTTSTSARRRADCRKLLRLTCEILNLPIDTCACAVTLAEKLYKKVDAEEETPSTSDARAERYAADIVCMTCTFLACKLEESVVGMSDCANACANAAHTLERCGLGVEQRAVIEVSEEEKRESREGARLAGYGEDEGVEVGAEWVIVGGRYRAYKERALELESEILRAVNYELNFDKPHAVALHLVRLIEGGSDLAQATITVLMDALFEIDGLTTGRADEATLAAAAVRYASKMLDCERTLRRSKDGRVWWDALGFDSVSMDEVEAMVMHGVCEREREVAKLFTTEQNA